MMGNQMAFPRRRRQRRVQGIGGKKLECGGEFTALTSTIFDSKKMPFCERIEFPLHLFEFHSLKACASDGRNAETTGRYCLSKVFAAPESETESAKKGLGRESHSQGIRKANRRMLDLGPRRRKWPQRRHRRLALKSEVHTSAETHEMEDEDSPLDAINDLHDKMEKFMRAHSGYDRARLQGWMNLFWLSTNG